MNHMGTAELITLAKEALCELERRFRVDSLAARPATAVFSLLRDKETQCFYYSVCGYPSRCACRYRVASDTEPRPDAIDECVLYVHNGERGDARVCRAELRQLYATGVSIKVVRNYAFLRFATHALAAEAQGVLNARGYSVSFARAEKE